MDARVLRERLLDSAAAGDCWAAVAIVLADGVGGPSILLIRRAEREDDPWSGQVACPGGRVDAEDRSPFEAAIRETREEVGLDLRRNAELLGLLPPRSPANRPALRVAPFVWSLPREEPLHASPEVVSAWYEPLPGLRENDREVTVSVRGRTVRTRAFVAGATVVWGFTYRVVADLLDRLGS